MPDGQSPSTVNYVVIDAESLTSFPADIRRAAELLSAFLDGITMGRMLADDAGDSAPAPRSTEPQTQTLRGRIESTLAAGHTPLRVGGCSLIAGDVTRVSEPGAERDIVLVWGPNAAATVRAVFPS
uniref:hypothetical protein n=1 Tax=Paractinoplanes polyasparticus TaxID=2856853 RepID=UPI001C85FE4E|nr:hypothetical protein [Actinoplanes polyasparticus]